MRRAKRGERRRGGKSRTIEERRNALILILALKILRPAAPSLRMGDWNDLDYI
jgi:hypothetical protein